jgi:hypothetical protein
MRLFTKYFLAVVLTIPSLLASASTYAVLARPANAPERLSLQTAPGPEARPLSPTLNVFPSPSRGQVTVQLSQQAGQDYKLRLSNLIGREVRLVALRPGMGEAGQVINLSDLPAGLYFYSLLVNDKVVSTKRLVLQN